MDKQNGFARFVCPPRKAPRKGKPMNEEPHIGKLIKAELARQGRSITWLAAQLNYSRQYVYKIFRRKWIYTDLLLKISDILDYDFLSAFRSIETAENKNNWCLICILQKTFSYIFCILQNTRIFAA